MRIARKRKATVPIGWFRLASGERPMQFWFDVGWIVKNKRIKKRDLDQVRQVICDVESSPRWKNFRF